MRKLLLLAAAASAVCLSGTANAATCTLVASVEKCFIEPGQSQFSVTFNSDGTISGHVGRDGIGTPGTIPHPSDNVGLGTIASPLTFEDTYHFIVDSDGTGSGLIGTSLSGAFHGTTDLDFTSISFNGNPLSISIFGGGAAESAFLINTPIVSGGDNYLVVSGKARGAGSYGGNLVFTPNAVPEPETWAMMLFGFGAVGFGLRRRKKEDARVRFAF